MAEEKVVKEQAEAEFENWADRNGIDIDTTSMDQEDAAQYDKQRKRIVTAIMKGNLIINDSGDAVYSLQDAIGPVDTITFYEPTGSTYMAADKKKAGQDVSKLYAMMAAMTKTTIQTFSKMKNRDLKICQGITLLFLD